MRPNLLQANALHIPLAPASVQCAVTSPPYWSLRDYGVDGQLGLEPVHDCLAWASGQPPCNRCYVCHMRAVFAEVWRVLRKDGTLWLNLGDSYNGSSGSGGATPKQISNAGSYHDAGTRRATGLKPKDLCAIPWRVALALQADGWYLRSDIIWSKPNPMPESVTDRPSKSHEYIFLLTKGERYLYDAAAVMEDSVTNDLRRPFGSAGAWQMDGRPADQRHGGEIRQDAPAGKRNRRTVWEIPTDPYSGAHFATYPPALVEPCIKAGTSEHGCCPTCGAPWRRVMEKTGEIRRQRSGNNDPTKEDNWRKDNGRTTQRVMSTTGWSPSCTCPPAEPIQCLVLDPFNGSGTTGLVAQQLGRRYVGLDLNPEYLQLARERTGLAAWDEWSSGKRVDANLSGLPMFAE